MKCQRLLLFLIVVPTIGMALSNSGNTDFLELPHKQFPTFARVDYYIKLRITTRVRTVNVRTKPDSFLNVIFNRPATNAANSYKLRAQGSIGQFINTNASPARTNGCVDGKIIPRLTTSAFSFSFIQYSGSDDGHGNDCLFTQ